MTKKILLILFTSLFLTGCKPEQYTKIEQIETFIPLENGNVEFVTVSDGRITTTILALKNIYYYDGESVIIEEQGDRYIVAAYLSKEDYEKLGRMRCEKWKEE